MADSSVPITSGTGTAIDTRTEATSGQHRQVVVLGDPSVNAGVAPVDVTAGLKVDLGADNDVTVTGAALTALQVIDNIAIQEDAVHASGDFGTMALVVRRDSGATLVSTDGDYSPLQVDAGGNLRVNIAAGAAAGGTSATDEASYTPTSSAGTPIMGAADESAPDAAAEGTLAIIRSTLSRALHVNLRDAAGAEVAVAGGTQYTEDAAAAANPVGNVLNLVRNDARSGSLVTTDGDNVAARGTNSGELYVKHVDTISVVQSGVWNVGQARSTTAALANVNASITSVTLQAANANRMALIIINESTSIAYVKYGSAASATSYTYKLEAYEQLREELYTGIMTGIWVTATGAARMTELTA